MSRWLRERWSRASRVPASVWWLALVAYSIGIWIQSSGDVPGLAASAEIHLDKLLHFGAFGLWGGLALLAFRPTWPDASPRFVALLAWCAAVAYGASDEFHQHFVAERSSDVLDLVADASGALVAVLVWRATFPHEGPNSARPREPPREGPERPPGSDDPRE